MKIVFVRHSLLSRGGDKMVLLHASHLAGNGHEVVIATNRLDTVFPLDERIRVDRLRYSGKIGTLISAALQVHNADAVIADIIPLACLLALRNRSRTIYFAQDYDESYYSSTVARLFIRLLYFIGLGILRLKTVAVAEHLAVTFKRRFFTDAVVVENGVDTDAFFPEPELGLASSKGQRSAILLLSRSDPRKGFDVAIRAIAELIKEEQVRENVEIWTVGEAAGGQLCHGVRHRDFGYVDEERLRKIMSSADLFFYPTRHEGYPLMVMEAFACGCPVVTTTAVSYVNHGRNALVGEVGDAVGLAGLVSGLLRDDDLRCRLITQGVKFAAEHSLSGSRQGFEEALSRFRSGSD